VSDIDMALGPNCGGGEMKIIAAILERAMIGMIPIRLLSASPASARHGLAQSLGGSCLPSLAAGSPLRQHLRVQAQCHGLLVNGLHWPSAMAPGDGFSRGHVGVLTAQRLSDGFQQIPFERAHLGVLGFGHQVTP